GEFPWQNLKLDGFEATSPVGSFPPDGYRLFDMTGNVWEWTTDFFTSRHDEETRACCAPQLLPGENFPRRVIKGGSHLCAPNYCLRYRPAARQGEAVDTSTGHIGFRCIIRPGWAPRRSRPAASSGWGDDRRRPGVGGWRDEQAGERNFVSQAESDGPHREV